MRKSNLLRQPLSHFKVFPHGAGTGQAECGAATVGGPMAGFGQRQSKIRAMDPGFKAFIRNIRKKIDRQASIVVIKNQERKVTTFLLGMFKDFSKKGNALRMEERT